MNTRTHRREVYVRPGEVVWSDDSIHITTILGSCVAVCVWHPQLRHGGLAHVMLPERFGPRSGRLDGRYMDEAFLILLEQMRRFGSPSAYQAKLFGGSGLLLQADRSLSVIGERNASRARELVREYGLILMAEDLGGPRFRKLAFHLDTGDVWLRRLVARHSRLGGAS